MLSCYTGNGYESNTTQCSSQKNAYCVVYKKLFKNFFINLKFIQFKIITISNSTSRTVAQSCIDTSCTAFSMIVGDSKYESKCCEYDNCNVFYNTPTTTPSKPLSCWVGGSFMGDSIPSVRKLCSEYENQYCNVIKFNLEKL